MRCRLKLQTITEVQREWSSGVLRGPMLTLIVVGGQVAERRILDLAATFQMATTAKMCLAARNLQRISSSAILPGIPCLRAVFTATNTLSKLSTIPQRRVESTLSQSPRHELLKRGNAPLSQEVIAKLTPPPGAYPHPYPQGVTVERPGIIEDVEGLEENRRNRRTSYQLSVHSSQNNSIFTLTDPELKVIFRTSPGMHGYRKFNRSTYEASHTCATAMVRRLEEEKERLREEGRDPPRVALMLNGFGQGREAMTTVLLSGEGRTVQNMVWTITDKTPIKVGGVRPRKAKRL
jgi:small subunit ribosomal protein S11